MSGRNSSRPEGGSSNRPEAVRQLGSNTSELIEAIIQYIEEWVDKDPNNFSEDISKCCKELFTAVQKSNEHFKKLANQTAIWMKVIKKVVTLFRAQKINEESLITECTTSLGLAVYGLAIDGNVNQMEEELFECDRAFVREGAVGRWYNEPARINLQGMNGLLKNGGVEVLEAVIRALVRGVQNMSLEQRQQCSRFVDYVFQQIATLLRLICCHYFKLRDSSRRQFVTVSISVRKLLLNAEYFKIQLHTDTARRLATWILPLCSPSFGQLQDSSHDISEKDRQIICACASNCLRGLLKTFDSYPRRLSNQQQQLYGLTESVLLLFAGLHNISHIHMVLADARIVSQLFAIFEQVLKMPQYLSSVDGEGAPMLTSLIPICMHIMRCMLGMHYWLDVTLIERGIVDLIFRFTAKTRGSRQKSLLLNQVIGSLLTTINKMGVEDTESVSLRCTDLLSGLISSEQVQELGIGMYMIKKMFECMSGAIVRAAQQVVKTPEIECEIVDCQIFNLTICCDEYCYNMKCPDFEGDSEYTGNISCPTCHSASYCSIQCRDADSYHLKHCSRFNNKEGSFNIVPKAAAPEGLMMLCQAAAELEQGEDVPTIIKQDPEYDQQQSIPQPSFSVPSVRPAKSASLMTGGTNEVSAAEVSGKYRQEFSFSGNIGEAKPSEVVAQSQPSEEVTFQQQQLQQQNNKNLPIESPHPFTGIQKNLFQVKNSELKEVEQLLESMGRLATGNIDEAWGQRLLSILSESQRSSQLISSRPQPTGHIPPQGIPPYHLKPPADYNYPLQQLAMGANARPSSLPTDNRFQQQQQQTSNDAARNAFGNISEKQIGQIIKMLTKQQTGVGGATTAGGVSNLSRPDDENVGQMVAQLYDQHVKQSRPRAGSNLRPGDRGLDLSRNSTYSSGMSNQQSLFDPGRHGGRQLYNTTNGGLTSNYKSKFPSSVEGGTLSRHLQNPLQFHNNTNSNYHRAQSLFDKQQQQSQHSLSQQQMSHQSSHTAHHQSHSKPIITTGTVGNAQGGSTSKSLAGEKFKQRAYGGGYMEGGGGGGVGGSGAGGNRSQVDMIDLSMDDHHVGSAAQKQVSFRNSLALDQGAAYQNAKEAMLLSNAKKGDLNLLALQLGLGQNQGSLKSNFTNELHKRKLNKSAMPDLGAPQYKKPKTVQKPQQSPVTETQQKSDDFNFDIGNIAPPSNMNLQKLEDVQKKSVPENYDASPKLPPPKINHFAQKSTDFPKNLTPLNLQGQVNVQNIGNGGNVQNGKNAHSTDDRVGGENSTWQQQQQQIHRESNSTEGNVQNMSQFGNSVKKDQVTKNEDLIMKKELEGNLQSTDVKVEDKDKG